jgi:hypothetical protein
MESQSLITPQKFLHAFALTTAQVHNELTDLWFNSPLYTGIMRGVVLPRIAATLGLQSWSKDYYYLDTVFYREKDMLHFPEHLTNVKYIEVALEHENVLSGTAQEMNKLQLFNAPLKVLITYDRTDSQRTEYLKKYEAIIHSADIFGDISTTRRQLVIFGRKPSEKIEWSAYVYQNEGFTSEKLPS